jgi:hypothetical protein
MKLFAGRFQNSINASQLELFSDAENIGVRWDIGAFGVEQIEVMIKCRNKWDLYSRYSDHFGHRLAIFGADHRRPISGYITEVRPEGAGRVTYIAKGPGHLLTNGGLDTTIYSPSATVSATLQSILTYYGGPIDTSDYTNIQSNATTLGGWQVRLPGGSTVTESINQLLQKRDSSYRTYDFWILDKPFNFCNLSSYVAYYKYRDSAATTGWVAKLQDLAGLSLARDINELRTDVTVYYGTITGTTSGNGGNNSLVRTATQTSDWVKDGVKPGDTAVNVTNNSRARVVSMTTTTLTVDRFEPKVADGIATGGSTTTLVDTGKNFVSLGVRVGDTLINVTNNTSITVSAVAATTLTHAATTANAAGNTYIVYPGSVTGDTYAVQMQNPTQFKTQVSVSPAYWQRVVVESEPGMDATQAAQYANALLRDAPEQVQSFDVGAKFIRDRSGRRWPLWEVIAQGGGYIRVPDLYPDFGATSNALNKLTTFFITSMDYDYKTNKLRLQVDNKDRRLDVALRNAGIVRSAMIGR